MKQLSRITRFGCLALVVGLAAFLGVLSLGILQESQTNGLVKPILSMTASTTDEKVKLPTEAAVTTMLPQDNGDNGALLVVTVAQLALSDTPIQNSLLEPSPTGTINTTAGSGVRNAPTTYPTTTPLNATAYLPYFGGKTLDAQTSATAMLAARTAWYGNLTQGARDYAATLRVIGTPIGR